MCQLKAKCCIEIDKHMISSLGYFKNAFKWAVLENIKRGTVVKTVQHPPLKSFNKYRGSEEKNYAINRFGFLAQICFIGHYGRNIRGISGLRRTTTLRTYGVDTTGSYYGAVTGV